MFYNLCPVTVFYGIKNNNNKKKKKRATYRFQLC